MEKFNAVIWSLDRDVGLKGKVIKGAARGTRGCRTPKYTLLCV